MTVILFATLMTFFVVVLWWSLLSPPRWLGRHRGTTGQLAFQAERRAEQEAEYAQAIVRADLIANGSRADWITVEG